MNKFRNWPTVLHMKSKIKSHQKY